MREPPCYSCKHCVNYQCAREWPDADGNSGVKTRVIRVATGAVPFPAHHVHRFWCAKGEESRGFETHGSGAKADLVYQAYAKAGLISAAEYRGRRVYEEASIDAVISEACWRAVQVGGYLPERA